MGLKFSAYWLRMPDPESAYKIHGQRLERLVERASLRVTPGSSFVELLLGDPEFSPAVPGRQEAFSALLGEAVLVDVADNVGQIRYARFVNGSLSRHMMYNYDCGWSQVAGDPAPWEKEVLFGPKAQAELESVLVDYDDEEYRAAARAIYKAGVVNAGAFFPRVDAVSLLSTLVDYYGVRHVH